MNRFRNFGYSEGQRWLNLLVTAVIVVFAIGSTTLLMESKPASRRPVATTQAVPPLAVQPAASAGDSPFGLRVESKPQQLEVHWDRDRQKIRQAASALIHITDGAISEVIPFDKQQLSDGYLAYKPVTNDVSIRLEADEGNGEVVSESVRVVATP